MKFWAIFLSALLFTFPVSADTNQDTGTGQRNLVRDLAINFPPDNPQGASIAIGQFSMPIPAIGNSGGQANIGIGYQSFNGVTTSAAQNDICIGYQGCRRLTSGANNIAVGVTAGGFTTGSRDIMFGYIAGQNISTVNDFIHFDPEGSLSVSAAGGSSNVTIGTHTGYSQANGTIVGADAIYGDVANTGGTVTALGANVGRTNVGVSGTVPSQVILIGGNGNSPQSTVLDGATNASITMIGIGLAHPGTNDTAVGYGALNSSTANTSKNSALGRNALTALTSGTNSVALGYSAGSSITTGSNNTVLGYSVGSSTLTTGSSNILIGTSSAVTTPASGSSNEINIGGLLFYNITSTAAPTVSACGTSPAIDSHANAKSGTVTAGTVSAASCTITFASAYSSWNHCRVTSQAGNITGLAYSYTKSAITITGTSIVGDVFDYDCDGY